MTERETHIAELKAELEGQLGGDLEESSTEATEVLEVRGTIGGKFLRAIVLTVPPEPDPEIHSGQMLWTVRLFGADCQMLGEYHHPEPSLKQALARFHWDRVRRDFAEGDAA